MNAQNKYRYEQRILWVLFLVIMLTGPAFGQVLVKVHKDKITVSAVNELGLIFVQGAPGAIETTSELTSLVVRNLSTNGKVLVQKMADGSFRAEIQGEPGNRIRVEARNQEGKRSIGTFDATVATTPTKPYAGWQTVKEVPQQPITPIPPDAPNPDTAYPIPPRKAGARNLAVMIMVIDMGRGELIAAERFVGVPRLNMPGEQLYPFTAQNIIHKCIDAIRTELKPTVGLGGYERKNPPRYQLSPSEKKPSLDKTVPSAPEKQQTVIPETPTKEKPNPSLKETEKKETEKAEPKTDEE